MSFLLLLSIASFLAAVFISCDSVKNTSQDVLVDVCHLVAGVVSEDSVVSFPGDSQYQAGIFHWASSSIQEAACSVEPATASDVGSILSAIGHHRVPFAVKGGGHTSNPDFSSTTGVQITMARFRRVIYDSVQGTARIGAGLDWDSVYEALEPHGVTVVGGRVPGVGVAGFTLGGGYSWKSNQHGLSLDNVLEYALVLPNGTFTRVTEASEPDLFFALRGGGNNFGIVTEFTFKTYPQSMVWGGMILYSYEQQDLFIAAVIAYQNSVTDPKASIIPCFNFYLGQPVISVLVFYDAPTPPAGIFDGFLDITFVHQDILTRTYAALVGTFGGDMMQTRIVFNTVPVTEYTYENLRAFANETFFWGTYLSQHSLTLLVHAAQPFLPDVLCHSGSPSAYPASRKRVFFPTNIHMAWTDPAEDEVMHEASRQSAAFLRSLAPESEDEVSYPNYAIWETPVERIYGSNLQRLRSIRDVVDPDGVMSLTGGFKVQ